MQNSDIVTSKTDKLFLLPNAADRLKRKNGGFDLTSAGLMSLIAACGGSSGGSTDTNTMGDTGTNTDTMGGTDTTTDTMGDTNPTVIDDIAQADLLTAEPSVYANSLTRLAYDGASLVNEGNNINMTRNAWTATVSSDASTFTLIAEDKTIGSDGNPDTYNSNSIAFSYGNIGGDDKVDLVVGSDTSADGKGSFAIIWDYDPTDDKFQGKTFNSTGDNYTGNAEPDNKNIPHLSFNTSKLTGTPGFGSYQRNAFVRVHSLEDEPGALFVGNSQGNLLAVVWDVGQYQRGATSTHSIGSTNTLEVKPAKDTMLIISSTNSFSVSFDAIRVLDLGDDSKADLLLPTDPEAEFKMIKIIWDIASHKSDEGALEIGGSASLADTENNNVFSIISSHNQLGDNAFPSDGLRSIDLDGDGSYDLHTSYRNGIVFWGSEFKTDAGDLRTDSIFIHDATGDVAFTGSSADPADGLWLNGSGATLEQLRDNFYFVDVDQDGLRDAIYKTEDAGNYSWWKLTGEKNVIADSADLSKGFGTAATITKAQLNAAGIYPDYYRKDVNDDGRPDFIAKAPNDALDNGKVYHNVWYAKANGSLDSTTDPDAWVEITPAASSLAAGSDAGADIFQLVDIA